MTKASDLFMKNLAALMKASGMRAADLARATGMPPQQLNGYLNEGRLPSIEKLDAFANAFGVTVADLFKSDAPPEPKISRPTPQEALAVIQEALGQPKRMQAIEEPPGYAQLISQKVVKLNEGRRKVLSEMLDDWLALQAKEEQRAKGKKEETG